MKYHTARTKIFIAHLCSSVASFFENLFYHTKNFLRNIIYHEKTQVVGYHLGKAKRKIVSSGINNLKNWNERLNSSESFKIAEDDV